MEWLVTGYVNPWMRLTRTTDETAQFKNEDCYQVGPLQGEIFKELPPGRCERSHSEEEGRSVPSNIGNTFELICDLWDGCCYDGLQD